MTANSLQYSVLDLAGRFRLTAAERNIDTSITLPGDVHTALLEANLIPDPYYGSNEQAVMWVNHTAWEVERSFEAKAEDCTGFLTLTLAEVDCIATVSLNGETVATVDNAFLRHDIDITGKLKPGANTLRITFEVARDVAKQRYDSHPFPIPFTKNYQTNGLVGVHMNFIRKAACHAGWDWGICLMPTGVYGRMQIRRSALARQESVQVEQRHGEGQVELILKTRVHAFAAGEIELSHDLDGQTAGGRVLVVPGENLFVHSFVVQNPRLWWPNGQGEQPLYGLTTNLDGEVTTRRIGLRKLEWVIEKDEIDHNFKVRINGRDITMMGANWIPADAIPSRITPDVVRDLLLSAAAANMNMIRIWGGGQYEPDYFYDMCDELGILLWQDFMFSCMPYPSDNAFLASVEQEIRQQVRRLQHHASVALWCGDNEVIGSLNWYEETQKNRDRFVANYDRLSKLLSDVVAAEDETRRFWPSSPSLGYLDFSDGWHVDTRGDMHYWDVWHSAKPFETYRTVNPRFASEFGFQSFTSMPVIESFAQPEDRNPSSPVMETHQRNDGGNARILETMTRYFRFPSNFDQMVFLSQIQQGLAMKTAIEYWRSTKPRCMGTLFWQINDTWPVASWASLDYGGGWKLLHYMAKRFFTPVNVVAVPEEGGAITLKAVNDTGAEVSMRLEVLAVDVAGGQRVIWSGMATVTPDSASAVTKVSMRDLTEGEFLFFSWADEAGDPLGENDFFPKAYKYYEMQPAKVEARWTGSGAGATLTLSTDKPAQFVTATLDIPGYFSDNSITLLPGRERQLTFTPRGSGRGSDPASGRLQVRHLRETY